jgi:hypothetical protein
MWPEGRARHGRFKTKTESGRWKHAWCGYSYGLGIQGQGEVSLSRRSQAWTDAASAGPAEKCR